MRLTFVGDIALGDHPKTVGFGFRSRYSKGIPPHFAQRIRPAGPGPDFMLGNLEFALAETSTATGLAAVQCRGASEYATTLAAAGLTALNVANNHCSQHGNVAFASTVATLRAAGLHVVGTAADFGESGVVIVAGRRIALLGWSNRPRQYSSEPPPYNEFDDRAFARIAEARQRADLVIASMHWGDEFILVPSEAERAIARAMIDAGATFVIGHHPHVVREVERYGNGVVAYSLGNFIGDMTWDRQTRFTSWLTADVEGDAVSRVELTPGKIDDDYFPRALTPDESRTLPGAMALETREQRKRLLLADYANVAASERRRHARRTAWMMLRNARRYPPGLAVELFRNAIGNRLRGASRS